MALRPDLATGLPFLGGWGELSLSSGGKEKRWEESSDSTGKVSN